MQDKKVKYIEPQMDAWKEAYIKEYAKGPQKNKPDVNLLPEDVYVYMKEKNILPDSPRYTRKQDAKTKED